MDIATSTNIFYERADGSRIPMEESIRACASAGYKLLDFGFVELAQQSKRFHGSGWKFEIEEYARLSQELGLRFVQAHATIFDFCNQDRSSTAFELFKRSIEGAKILGAPWLVAHPSTGVEHGVMRTSTHQENVAFFKEMAEYAGNYGIGIAIENMWRTTSEGVRRYAVDPAELLQLIEDVNCENIGACWDVIHGSLEGFEQGESIRLLGKHLKGTHLSDETGMNNIHILPYNGFVNWDDLLQTLAEIDYSGPFVFEVQHYLHHVPKALVSNFMELSVTVGREMIRTFEQYKIDRMVD